MADYDNSNIFARILRGEIPVSRIYEDEFALAFPDIQPQAPVHVLVVPKGRFISAVDFYSMAPAALIAGFCRAVAAVAAKCDVAASGFRLISNAGADGRQSVPHFHVHILGGRPLAMALEPAIT